MSALLSCASLRRLQVVLGLAFVGLGGAASAQAAPFVYATNVGNPNVLQYNAAGGALTPLAPATVSTQGNQPLGLAGTPDGRNVYVGISSSSAARVILQYTVGPNGALALKLDHRRARCGLPRVAGGQPERSEPVCRQ